MENQAFIKVQYPTRPRDNRNWICAVLTINIFVRHLGDKLAQLPAKFQSSGEYIDFNIPGLVTHMVLFWGVNSVWLVDATKACNSVSIGGLFPDGAKALPEPSSMRYLSSTVTIELNVDTHVRGMLRINPVMLQSLFWDCPPLTLCILGLALIINWVLTIGFISALRTCDLNLGVGSIWKFVGLLTVSLLSCLPGSNLKWIYGGNVFANSLWPVDTATSLN